MRRVMPKRYCGFKMVSEDGVPAPAPWKKSTGFTVKEEVSEPMEEEVEEEVELSPTPNKKLKTLLAEVLTSKSPN